MEASSLPPDQSQTRVGIRELRHDFRAWLDRARAGERIVVTDRGQPIADLVPHRQERTWLQQMRDSGLTMPARRPRGPLPTPFRVGGSGSTAGSAALQEQREERLP
jgi:prevent-host-death family protein